MADLSQLMQVAPNTGAFFTGQNHASDQQKALLQRQELAATLAKMQQEMEFNSQANPLRLEQMGLTNKTTSAQLPGIVADSEKKGLDTRMTRETFDTTRDTTNSTNKLTQMGNHIKQAQAISDVFTNAAVEVQEMPPPMRAARLRQIVSQHQMDPNSPEVQQFVVQASENPNILVQRANLIKQNIAQNTPAYIQALAQEKLRGENNLAEARVRNAGNLAVAQENRQSKVEAAKARAGTAANNIFQQVMSGKLKAAEMPAAFTTAARFAKDEEERDFLLQEASRAAEMLLARPNARPQPQLKDGEIVSEVPENPYAATGRSASAPDAQLGAALEAANVPYEPDKYDYRVGPTGTLQRKPKGK